MLAVIFKRRSRSSASQLGTAFPSSQFAVLITGMLRASSTSGAVGDDRSNWNLDWCTRRRLAAATPQIGFPRRSDRNHIDP